MTTSGLVPSGVPTWTFRYTPKTFGTFAVAVSVTTFNGTGASTSTSAKVPFSITADAASGYRGFVQIDRTPGDESRYYQYSQSRQSVFAVGADLDVPELADAGHPAAELALFGGSPGAERTLNGHQTAGVGEEAGLGKTGATLAGVYERYMSDIANLAAEGADSGRLRLDSRFLPLELCPAGKWAKSCSTDLEESYYQRSPTHQIGLVGYLAGVMPAPSEVFSSSAPYRSTLGPSHSGVTTMRTPGSPIR